jgi:CPA2 family monovalent cation:H+ antiporter-2
MVGPPAGRRNRHGASGTAVVQPIAMHHGPDLMLATLVACILLAFGLGAGARALKLPALIGYIAAGLVISPYTPGFVAERGMVTAMAEVGVALLLFGVGLHFRPADLAAVWRVAVPGAVLQIAFAGLLGALVGTQFLGLGAGTAMAFGLALAISSTAVATKALEERGKLGGQAGRVALGWLVMQDLVVVFALVTLPAVAGGRAAEGGSLLLGIAKAAFSLAAFGGLMWLFGRRALPWLLVRVARGGSRELFTLAVLAIALGVAFVASTLFGVSFALGAFFAGVVLGESDVGHQAAAEATPLQRIFSAIFFVSVGMLLDPAAVAEAPVAAAFAVLAVLVGIGGGALALLLLLRVHPAVAVTVAGALAQIGEFSFLLVELAVQQAILPELVRGPVLVAAVATILVSPLVLRGLEALGPRLERSPRLAWWRGERRPRLAAAPLAWPLLERHAVVVGSGRVGAVVIRALQRHHLPLIAIEEDRMLAEQLVQDGTPVVWGDATRPEVFRAAAPERAALLVVALPGAVEARAVLQLALAANPQIHVVVRTHSDDEAAVLEAVEGVGLVMMGEREVALGMADYAMQRLGVPPSTAQATVDVLRGRRLD